MELLAERVRNAQDIRFLKNIIYLALLKGVEFYRDHGRNMTHNEREEWIKKALIERGIE